MPACRHGYADRRNCGRCAGAAGRARGVALQSGRSTYENRDQAGPVTVVMSRAGQWLGLERAGQFEPARPCCDDPLRCARAECWTPIDGRGQ